MIVISYTQTDIQHALTKHGRIRFCLPESSRAICMYASSSAAVFTVCHPFSVLAVYASSTHYHPGRTPSSRACVPVKWQHTPLSPPQDPARTRPLPAASSERGQDSPVCSTTPRLQSTVHLHLRTMWHCRNRRVRPPTSTLLATRRQGKPGTWQRLTDPRMRVRTAQREPSFGYLVAASGSPRRDRDLRRELAMSAPSSSNVVCPPAHAQVALKASG
ncbi:hypothetical protein C8T65DRAFT_143881 [Cerioporus squamosus]|nr:hypothetical protein C8T65DRAFT_143881 [Cerioporus squamosus]